MFRAFPPMKVSSASTFAGQFVHRTTAKRHADGRNTSAPATWSAKTSRLRMHMRRFTRLTNGFSKKLENHVAAVSLHFMYYNLFASIRPCALRLQMAAGVTDRVWEIADIVQLLEAWEGPKDQERDERKYNPFGPVLGQGN